MSMLKVEGLNVYYGSIHAIKGVSFEVNQGEIVTMIGANGAGKSTTMNTVFQQMSVRENLEMGGYTRPAGEIAASLDQVFEQFPRLKERQRQISGTLSGGEQQMLAMGRALMSKPKLLMLDEPSMGLAPILVEQIFEIILKLNQTGTTILLVEQNAQMALSIANRAYVLETGHIVKEGSADTLMHDDAVRKAYLG